MPKDAKECQPMRARASLLCASASLREPSLLTPCKTKTYIKTTPPENLKKPQETSIFLQRPQKTPIEPQETHPEPQETSTNLKRPPSNPGSPTPNLQEPARTDP